jgi:hypothetical protein
MASFAQLNVWEAMASASAAPCANRPSRCAGSAITCGLWVVGCVVVVWVVCGWGAVVGGWVSELDGLFFRCINQPTIHAAPLLSPPRYRHAHLPLSLPLPLSLSLLLLLTSLYVFWIGSRCATTASASKGLKAPHFMSDTSAKISCCCVVLCCVVW